MTEILGNIYGKSIAIVFRNAFFCTFWRLWDPVVFFLMENFSKSSYIFFYPKNSRTASRKIAITQEWLVMEGCPTPRWVAFNPLLTVLKYTVSFEWPFFGLKCLVTVMPKGQPPKLTASAWNFLISKTGRNCNSLFIPAGSYWVIIMELSRKVKYS